MGENFGGLEWKDMDMIHPVGLAAVMIMGVAMLLLPRKWAILPMMIIACFIPLVQKIVIFNLDFNFLRIMVLFGFLRLLIKKDYSKFSWRTIDKVILYYSVSATIILTLQTGSISTFISRLGVSLDVCGTYFLFRCLIQDWQDIDKLILGCIIISIPVAIVFMIELHTHHNMFSIFGGVPKITVIRQGELRCQGAFSHPILAGSFWAAMVPIFITRWWKNGAGKFWAVIGFSTTTFIIYACHSSTPVFGYVGFIVGGLMFFLRYQMRTVRWAAVLILCTLHIVMEGPAWHLISRMSAVGGSTSYFRYKLIDSAINHFGEWFLIGTRSTAHWFYGAQDVPNHYILEGVRGGLITLVLFIATIVLAFQGVGRLWRASVGNRYHLAIAWLLGVSLFVHCLQFIGVAYFGQIYIVWYLNLAMITSMSPPGIKNKRKRVATKASLARMSRAKARTGHIQRQPKTHIKQVAF